MVIYVRLFAFDPRRKSEDASAGMTDGACQRVDFNTDWYKTAPLRQAQLR
jgi:hypothetical protein